MQDKPDKEIFTLMKQESFIERLARELRDLPKEMSASPASYLRAALLPDSINSWLPLSLANHFAGEVAYFFRHPIQFIKGVLSPDAISLGYIYQPAYTAAIGFTSYIFSAEKKHIKRSPLLISLLSVSAVFHAVFITYLLYIAIVAPYASLRVVNKPYRQYDDKLVAVIPPSLKLPSKSLENTMSLEEIRARDQKRREEEERKRREAEERKRKEEEKAAQAKADQEAKDKAAAEQAKAAEQKTDEPKTDEKPKFGEINEAPIKDILGKVYAMYQVGFAKVDVTNMTMAASFKIEKDGSITNIHVYKSSGDRFIDTQAKAVLHNLGESHALTPLAILTSNTIQLELSEKNSRLSIIGFAPSPSEAKRLATDLNGLFFLMRMARKSSSPDVAELMSLMKVTYSGNRVEANLIVSRDRAAEMMKNKFGNGGAQ
jgi:hypothetical protein